MAEFPLEYRNVPPEEEGDGPAPLVLLLHGRGADMDDLLDLADHLPDEYHVLSVQAPDPLGPGYTWYELDLTEGLEGSQPDPEDFRRSLDRLEEFRETALEAYDVDPDRVGLLGFSQGAILLLASIIDRPSAYAWGVALHGYLPESHVPTEADVEGFPMFLGAGAADQIIARERVEAAADACRSAGMDVTFEVYPSGHSISPDELTDVVRWIRERN